jgi:hypothetical protein
MLLLYENIKLILDISFRYVFVGALVYLALNYTIKQCKKDFWQGFYLGFLAFCEAGFAFVVIYLFPWWFAPKINHPEYEINVRWLVLYMTLPLLWWLLTKKRNGLRGLFFSLIVLTVFLIGWQFDRWIGIFLVSLPVLGIIVIQLDRLAQVILPPSIPDPPPRYIRRQKRTALIKYMAGIQYPVWLAKSKADRELEMRIRGSPFNSIGVPGVISTWSHQVAALTSGTNFAGIVGPGTVFTSRFQRPITLVDLRTQLRVTTTETVTKDGIRITAVVFMAFRVHHVRMALSRMGLDQELKKKGNTDLVIHWDEWVIKQVEDAARQVVADRELERLWRPKRPGESALDEMAATMVVLLRPKLQNAGVEIFTARIVNFDLKEENEEDKKIIDQYLETWRTNLRQKITQAEAEVNAIYRQELEQAHAYAKSALLETVAESLENARRINTKLPRHVIAQYYIHALDEYIKKQPGLNDEEIKARVESLQQVLLFSREGND